MDSAWLNANGGVGPFYLDQAGKTYALMTNVTTKGTAFALIKSVTLDLNCYTVTYDNATPITVFNGSFEQGNGTVATGWNFASAPAAVRHQGVWLHNEVYDGAYSLRFDLTAGSQNVTSAQTVTLEPNTTYSLSGMFEFGGQGDHINPGVKGYVRLVGSGLPTREVFWQDTNWRGIQLREGVFTTGALPETYSVHVGIQSNGHTPSKMFYVDDIKIQRTKVYGIFAGPTDWAASTYTDVTRFGAAADSVVKNGTIIQGQDGATWGHGVMHHDANRATYRNLNITVNGANASALLGWDQYSYTVTVSDNVLTSNVRTITSRDQGDGTVISGFQGVISGNTITNGPLSGILTNGYVPSQISGNTIRLKSKYTNAFAIVGNGGSDIYNNTIECGTGEYYARGLRAAGTAGRTAQVYGNTIEVAASALIQEYENAQQGGGYGMQIEGVGDVDIFDNTVTAYAKNGVEAHAFRANSVTSPIHVYNNTFNAVSDGSAMASVVKLLDIQESDILFENNTLNTNYGLIGGSIDAYMLLKNSTMHFSDPLSAADPVIFESGYHSGPDLNTHIRFADTTFTNPWTRNVFETAITRVPLIYSGIPEYRMAFSSLWTTTVQVRNSAGAPVANQTVTIRNTQGTQVFSGVTDGSGRVTTLLAQFRTQGDQKTTYSPYTITVGSVTQQMTANGPQTVTITL